MREKSLGKKERTNKGDKNLSGSRNKLEKLSKPEKRQEREGIGSNGRTGGGHENGKQGVAHKYKQTKLHLQH